ncbi:putative glycosidase CRH2 [Marasmius crinis-equi]|uniref:Glycosidase CRH2 n=1 Tax=Marasmius crinis-equi TaxID=585013 RepID=A0ABR3F486_9AGAR
MTVSNVNEPNYLSSPFVALTSPQTYDVSPTEGLTLKLLPPQGPVTRHENVNDQLGVGPTLNSTFRVGRGSITTFEIASSTQPGSVIAAILIDANEDSGDKVRQDEIDWELLPGDPEYCQTNLFAPTEADTAPHYGVFSGRHDLGKGSTVFELHSYSISLFEDKIEWGVDGTTVRTLHKSESYIDGALHWPRHNFLISLGLWDGSGATGTSHWAKGPILWEQVTEPIVAHVKKVTVECV